MNNLKEKLSYEIANQIKEIVPYSYDLDRNAALPYEARTAYLIGELIITRLDKCITDALYTLEYVVNFKNDIAECPKDYFYDLIKNIYYHLSLAVSQLYENEDIDEYIKFYLTLHNYIIMYRMYNEV